MPPITTLATVERRLHKLLPMPQDIRDDAEEISQEPIDCDAFWGPFVRFRPAKHQAFSSLRAVALAAVFGAFFGLALNLIAALASGGVARLPSVYAIPSLLAAAGFIGLQTLLAPAWNRRAQWLKRRQEYLAQLRSER